MKHFKIYNEDLNNWIERNFVHAIDVIRFIESHEMPTYTIEWKTPVTGEYVMLVRVQNGKKVFENENFKLPSIFQKIK